MKVIAYFTNNNKNYIIGLSNNNVLQYFVKDNDKIKTELSKSELEMFEKVVDSIKVSEETSIDLGMQCWKNELFRLFYDKYACLYYTNKNNAEISLYLNFKYNNVPDIYCEDYNQFNENDKTIENNKKFFKVPIRVGKKIIIIFLAATLSLSFLSACNSLDKNDDGNLITVKELTEEELKELNEKLKSETDIESKEREPITIESDQEIQQYDYLDIEKAIDNNGNLTNEEKDFIKKMRFVFDENHQFMDIEMVKERLATIKINYQGNDASKINIGGTYNSNKNEMTIYQSTSIDDCNITTFVHEFLHSLEKPSNSFLKELSNEFFARETVRRMYDEGSIQEERLIGKNGLGIPIFGDGYNDYMAIYYTLAEIIDSDDLRKFQFDCDTNTIIYALANCDNGNKVDNKEAYNFVANINNARTFDYKTNAYLPMDDSFATMEKAYNSLNYYYNIKKGHNIDEDLDVAIYFLHKSSTGILVRDMFRPYSYNTIEDVIKPILLEHSPETDENSMLGAYRVVTPKSYLNDEHPNSYITFNSPVIVTVELDDSINKEFRDVYLQYKETQEEIDRD